MSTFDEVLNEQAQYYIHATSAPTIEKRRVLKHNETFGVFDQYGDIDAGAQSEEGIYHHGTRFLSRLRLKLLHTRPLLLSSAVRRDNVLLAVDLTNPDVFNEGRLLLSHGTLHIYRSQFIFNDTLYKRVQVRNFALAPIEISFLMEFGADFADIFEVRGETRERRGHLFEPRVENDNRTVVLEYEGLDNVLRRTVITLSPPVEVLLPSTLHFTVRLDPGEQRSLEFEAGFQTDSRAHSAGYSANLALATSALEEPGKIRCQVTSSNDQVNTWLERSRSDLNMLLTDVPHGSYPYAGVPWFSTPFGRDGVITALECLWIAPQMARGVLSFLAETQAHDVSPEQDAEPGKILHEARRGEMAALGEVPFRRYYGSVDSTPLFLMLAGAYYRRTGDLAFVESIWPNIELASNWIDRYGDSDGDGFVEYSRHSSKGLVQQGWKDSHDSVFHADGTLATAPIALCEVQGYTYRAKLSVAGIAADLGYHSMARQMTRDARHLKRQFNHAFWSDALGTYALALDGKKNRCEVRSSNAGQCLFTGIATKRRAFAIAEQLLMDKFFSGWGIRTIAEMETRYNPMSYHNGSVWPHDNALIAAGFSRYRLTQQAARIMTGLFEASTHFDLSRLPELFCGFARRPGKAPTLYPVACAPQAWSAGAAFLLLQSSIGLSIDAIQNRILLVRPVLPPFLQELRIQNLAIRDSSVDLVLFHSGDAVAVTVEQRTGDINVVVVN